MFAHKRDTAFSFGMSALGQKQTFSKVCAMSALLPIADIRQGNRDVRFLPTANIAPWLRLANEG